MDHTELILHPVRMRIILALANRALTTQQVAQLLPDIAQTTLYRHIAVLLEGGIVQVLRESKVRGSVERELALVEGAGRIDMKTSSALQPEQQEHLFTMVIAALLAEFRQAQSQPLTDMPPAFYARRRLYLAPDEAQHVNQQIDEVLAAYKSPVRETQGRIQPWLFTGIVMPDADVPQSDQEIDP